MKDQLLPKLLGMFGSIIPFVRKVKFMQSFLEGYRNLMKYLSKEDKNKRLKKLNIYKASIIWAWIEENLTYSHLPSWSTMRTNKKELGN
jgi:hypothetical protein